MNSTICMYASKPCLEPRAIKDSGELHRLCDFHRSKANEAQRRWHSRHCSGTEPIPPKKKRKSDGAKSIRKRQRSPKAVADVVELAVSAMHAPLPALLHPDVFVPEHEYLKDEDFALLDGWFGQGDYGSFKLETESMEWLLNSHQLASPFFANV